MCCSTGRPREVRSLFKQRKALVGLALLPFEPVYGYLTRPHETSGKLPLVLVIHGGRYARDFWGFGAAMASKSRLRGA
jgi:hypothetical protein